METRELLNGMVELVAGPDMWLHLKGTDTYVRRAPVMAGRVGEWEEVDSAPAYTKADYDREVERLIAERYTTGQEIQFAREKEEAREKFTEYLAYVEACKLRAVENLTGHGNIDDSSQTTRL